MLHEISSTETVNDQKKHTKIRPKTKLQIEEEDQVKMQERTEIIGGIHQSIKDYVDLQKERQKVDKAKDNGGDCFDMYSKQEHENWSKVLIAKVMRMRDKVQDEFKLYCDQAALKALKGDWPP